MSLKHFRKYLPPFFYDFLNSTLFPFLNYFVGFNPKQRRFSRPSYRQKTNVNISPKTVARSTFNLGTVSLVLTSVLFAGLGQWVMVTFSLHNILWFKINTLWWSLTFFGIAIIFFLYALKPWKYENLQRAQIPPKIELIFFGLIMLIAAFFRIYKLDQIPNGIFMDQGFQGLAGLMIGHNDFQQPVYSLGDQPVFLVGKPFWEQPFFLGKPLEAPAYLLYLLAIWFRIFHPNQFTLYFFFACLALASFPLIYWTFRQIAGPRLALLTFYLLAVMRWHVNFSRNGFPTIEVPFYMFGTIAFLLYGYRKEKTWPYFVSAVFLSLGLYTYQAFKIFPLLLLTYGFYEFFADRGKFVRTFASSWPYALFFAVWAIPSAVFFMLNHNFPKWIYWVFPLLLLLSGFYKFSMGNKKSRTFNYSWIFPLLFSLYVIPFIIYFTLTHDLSYWTYLIFPILLLAYGFNKYSMRHGKLTHNFLSPWIFITVFAILTAPVALQMISTGSLGSREGSDNILGQIRSEHSFKPVVKMVTKTLLMCNREGDDNERHNIPNQRMLDDVSGTLFFLGVFYALSRIKRRKYFYAVSGLCIMSLACLLSVVPAHANRMLATTPFICFLAAAPLAAIWGRVLQRWGLMGEMLFLLLIFEPLAIIGIVNFHDYFVIQPQNGAYWNSGFWGGYSYDASVIGKMIAEKGDAYDYYLDPRHYQHNTVRFLSYELKDHVKQFNFPAGFAPLQTDSHRGIIYAFLAEQKGIVQIIQSLYPHCELETVKNQNGQPFIYYVKVPVSDVAQAKGLRMDISGENGKVLPNFPAGLPAGPYRATFTGSIYLDRTSIYKFDAKSNGTFSWSVGGHKIFPGIELKLAKGFYRVDAHLTAPSGPVSLQLSKTVGIEKPSVLDNSQFSALIDLSRGLKGSFYDKNFDQVDLTVSPIAQEWDNSIDFYGDFPYSNWREAVRWEGSLIIPKTGTYQFTAVTDEYVKIIIDGKEVVHWNRNNPTGSATLLMGAHRFQLDFQKILGPSLMLYWTPPGSKEMEVIPNHFFGFAN